MSIHVKRVVASCLVLVVFVAACERSSSGTMPIEAEDVLAEVSATATSTSVTMEGVSQAPSPTSTSIPPTQTLEPTSTPTVTPTPSWVGPDAFPEGVNPLTGLAVEDPTRLERRPVLIKVSNYPVILRPHSGLSYADIVFSYFIGEGMTRFLALYYGQDAYQVGPMRSGRLIDPQIVTLYGGFLGMVGADKAVWSSIESALPGRFLTEMPINCPALCDNGYGTAFANTEAFTDRVRELGLDDQRPALAGMKFDPVVPEGGQDADQLWLYISYYNQVEWDYDPESGAYLRLQEEDQEDGTVELKPMTDRLTDEQLAFKNVVVLFAWHNIIQPELIGIELQTVENERALVFRDGRMYETTYSAVSPVTPLRFYDAEGQPFSFKPGNTWIEIVGLGTVVEEIESGSWKVHFYP
jgi:hypothetical protein